MQAVQEVPCSARTEAGCYTVSTKTYSVDCGTDVVLGEVSGNTATATCETDVAECYVVGDVTGATNLGVTVDAAATSCILTAGADIVGFNVVATCYATPTSTVTSSGAGTQVREAAALLLELPVILTRHRPLPPLDLYP